LSDAELPDGFAHRGDDSGEFVAWYMGQLDIGIVSHPSVPIASADTASFQFDHRIVIAWDWRWDLLDRDGSLEVPEDRSAHGVDLLGGQFGRFVGKDASFDGATAFADGLGVVDSDRDLAYGTLDDAFEIGFPEGDQGGDSGREDASCAVGVLGFESFGLDGDIFFSGTEDVFGLAVDLSHFCQDESRTHLVQIVDGFGDILVGVQSDSGEPFEFESVGGHEEGFG
jgi:hypothetical protein